MPRSASLHRSSARHDAHASRLIMRLILVGAAGTVLVVLYVRMIVVVLSVAQPRGGRHDKRARFAQEGSLALLRGNVRIENEEHGRICNRRRPMNSTEKAGTHVGTTCYNDRVCAVMPSAQSHSRGYPVRACANRVQRSHIGRNCTAHMQSGRASANRCRFCRP